MDHERRMRPRKVTRERLEPEQRSGFERREDKDRRDFPRPEGRRRGGGRRANDPKDA
jgi:hypothetical protein